jgi:hypothetical protein
MKVYHATSTKNVASIKEKGLLAVWEGVYLTDSKESALRWIGFRLKAMGESEVAIVEAEVNPRSLIEGTDHSPLMEMIFGVGKSLLSPKAIPANKIKSIEIIPV